MLLALCVFYTNACNDNSDVGETKIVIEAPVIADITLNSAEVKVIVKVLCLKREACVTVLLKIRTC